LADALTVADIQRIYKLADDGKHQAAIVKETGFNKRTVRKYLKNRPSTKTSAHIAAAEPLTPGQFMQLEDNRAFQREATFSYMEAYRAMQETTDPAEGARLGYIIHHGLEINKDLRSQDRHLLKVAESSGATADRQAKLEKLRAAIKAAPKETQEAMLVALS